MTSGRAPDRRPAPPARVPAGALTLRDALLARARLEPDRVFVRCVLPDGERSLTYRELIERGSGIASGLRAAGVPPRAIVLLVLPHSTDLYAAFFGAVVAGLVPSVLAVPSFKLDPVRYREELQALAAHIEAAALVTDAATAAQIGFAPRPRSHTRVLLVEQLPASGPVPEAAAREDDVVLLQHSSGSTGLKKGVALSNRAVLRHLEAYAPALALAEDDHIASWLPLYHDMGLIACAVLPAVCGVPVTALNPLHWVTRPASLLRAIHHGGCTLAWLPNFAYEFLAARVRGSELAGLTLHSMRGWINCSEPTLAQSHRRFLERFRGLGVREETLWTCYASAETTFAVAQSSPSAPPRVERVERAAFLAGGHARRAHDEAVPALEMMSAGPLLAGTETRIVDEAGRELPERRVGEIAVRGPSVFSGYFRQPDATGQVLQGGWYRTGDLGYLGDGHLFVTGRKKDLIIIAGVNYYPQDVERAVSGVAGVHPGRVVALGLHDEAVGTQRLIVMAEVEDPALADSPELAARIRRAVAQSLDCVIDDLRLLPHMSLLKTSSGKIARGPNLHRYVQEFRAGAGG